MEPISVTEYRRQFGSIVHMYQACMHVGKRSALVRSKYIIFKKERKSVCKLLWEISLLLKFIYSEKATKFFKISTIDLSYAVPVKSTVEILQIFVAFLEYKNFNNFHFF